MACKKTYALAIISTINKIGELSGDKYAWRPDPESKYMRKTKRMLIDLLTKYEHMLEFAQQVTSRSDTKVVDGNYVHRHHPVPYINIHGNLVYYSPVLRVTHHKATEEDLTKYPILL